MVARHTQHGTPAPSPGLHGGDAGAGASACIAMVTARSAAGWGGVS